MSDLSDIDIETKVIPHLRHQFREARPILFTGAGFSLGAKSNSGQPVPSAVDLAQHLWGIAYPDIEFDPHCQLQDVFEAAVQTKKTAVRELLSQLFTIDRSSLLDYQRELLSLPWACIYTLNIDDLIENALSEQGQPFKRISALHANINALTTADKVKVIHLNGVLEDAPDHVTFSREQYAGRSDDAFFATLVRDLKFNPVIFFGTSLEENLLWKYLHLRGNPGGYREHEFRPRSYLIVPHLDLPKASLLSRFNIHWFKGRADDFHRRIFPHIVDDAKTGARTLVARLQSAQRPLIQPVGSRNEKTVEPSEYLFGAEPTWDDALSGRIAHRPSYDGLTGAIDRALTSQSPPNLIIVSGTAGSGKSSAMRLEALMRSAAGFECGWVDRNSLYEAVKLDSALESQKHLRIAFIEDADLLGDRLVTICQDVQRTSPQLVIVAECRSAKVDRLLFGKLPSDHGALEFTIPNLADEDIECLLEVLTSENRLGMLKGKSPIEQFEILKNECGRQLLVAMFKATQGREFQEKAVDEFLELPTDQKVIYAMVAVSHAHRLLTRH